MRRSLMVLVTLAGAAAFASGAQAGDAAKDSAAVEADGGCGFGQVHLQAQNDADDKAATRAKLEALIDSALATKEAAVAPISTPVPAAGG